MKIHIVANSRDEYISSLADIFGLQRRKRDLFIGLVKHYWSVGRFHTTMESMTNAFPWAGSYTTIINGIKHFCKLGLIIKDKNVAFLYHINPDILINSGSSKIEILISRDSCRDSSPLELMIPKTVEIIDTEITENKYINPRYANLL